MTPLGIEVNNDQRITGFILYRTAGASGTPHTCCNMLSTASYTTLLQATAGLVQSQEAARTSSSTNSCTPCIDRMFGVLFFSHQGSVVPALRAPCTAVQLKQHQAAVKKFVTCSLQWHLRMQSSSRILCVSDGVFMTQRTSKATPSIQARIPDRSRCVSP